MTFLGASGRISASSSVGGFSGGAGSVASFSNSKTLIFCVLPSSRRVKSFSLRFSTRLPDWSFTVTSTTTRLVVELKVGRPATGAGGVGWPTAVRATSVMTRDFRMSEVEPQSQIDGAGLGGARGQAVGGRVHRGSDVGDHDVVERVGGVQAQLDLLLAVGQAECAAEAGVERGAKQAGNCV